MVKHLPSGVLVALQSMYDRQLEMWRWLWVGFIGVFTGVCGGASPGREREREREVRLCLS
jgi:hypothetical protein